MEKLDSSKRAYHHGDLERGLIATALRIISSGGIDALTLRAVGAQVGVSRSALYRHFDDKDALLARIATDGFRVLADTLNRVLENASRETADTLQVMAAAHIHFARANPAHYSTMFGEGRLRRGRYPGLDRQADAAFRAVVSAVETSQQRGFVGRGDPITIAQVMWALTIGIASLGTAGRLNATAAPEELAVLGVGWCQTAG